MVYVMIHFVVMWLRKSHRFQTSMALTTEDIMAGVLRSGCQSSSVRQLWRATALKPMSSGTTAVLSLTEAVVK